jgi:hypothetical protein
VQKLKEFGAEEQTIDFQLYPHFLVLRVNLKMRGRGVVLLTSALQRYSKASPIFSPQSASRFSAYASPSPLSSSSISLLAVGTSSAYHSASGTQRDLTNGEGRQWIVPLVAGAGAFSASFAYSSMHATLAKERIAADRLPQEVILYQYEACPFCNKVKG